MSQGTKFAIALVLLWLAGIGLFIAFHPGGLELDGKPVENPAEVIQYYIQLVSKK